MTAENEAPPEAPRIPRIDQAAAAAAPAPCADCKQNAERLDVLERQVMSIGKIVIAGLVAAAVVYFLAGREDKTPLETS